MTSAGLCPLCRHALAVTSARGSAFWRCRRPDDDPRVARYPRLPVVTCPGFEPRVDPAPEGS